MGLSQAAIFASRGVSAAQQHVSGGGHAHPPASPTGSVPVAGVISADQQMANLKAAQKQVQQQTEVAQETSFQAHLLRQQQSVTGGIGGPWVRRSRSTSFWGRIGDGIASGFRSAVNFVAGSTIGFAKSLVKGMFCDAQGNFSLGKTLISAATIGACFIPGVGPFIGMGLAAYGLSQTVPSLISNAGRVVSSYANGNFEEAELAAYDAGQDATGAALSLMGVRAGYSACRAQIGNWAAASRAARPPAPTGTTPPAPTGTTPPAPTGTTPPAPTGTTPPTPTGTTPPTPTGTTPPTPTGTTPTTPPVPRRPLVEVVDEALTSAETRAAATRAKVTAAAKPYVDRVQPALDRVKPVAGRVRPWANRGAELANHKPTVGGYQSYASYGQVTSGMTLSSDDANNPYSTFNTGLPGSRALDPRLALATGQNPFAGAHGPGHGAPGGHVADDGYGGWGAPIV